MSPKTSMATSSLAILSLTLALASLCSANTNPKVNQLRKLLKQYDIPPGLFPANVVDFKCTPLLGPRDSGCKLSVDLSGDCNVARELVGVKNVVTCKKHMSAILSYRKLSDVHGVTVDLYVAGQHVGDTMIVTEATVFGTLLGNVLQFDSDNGPSPWFPVALIQDTPTCEKTAELIGSRDIPDWAFKYGRLMPIVIAS